MTSRQYMLLGCGIACIAASLAVGQRAKSAPKVTDVPLHMSVRTTARPVVRVANDPFIALEAGSTTNAMSLDAVANGKVVDAPLPPPVPAPNGPPAAANAQALVLCATWDSSSDGKVPTAVFAIGADSIVAGPGNDVGGYTLKTVSRDSVTFVTGEMLGIGDCSKLERAESTDTEAAAPTANSDINANAMSPSVPAPPIAPAPTFTTPANPFTASSTIQKTYNASSSTSTYSNSVYGQPAPSTAPYPYPPNFKPTRVPGAPQ